MRRLFREGNRLLDDVVQVARGRSREQAENLLNLGRFIENTVSTTIHVKQWYKLKCKIIPPQLKSVFVIGEAPQREVEYRMAEGLTVEEMERTIREMAELAEHEIENAEATIPLVEMDSRLGFEPSMDYMCDRAHLEWKIRMTRRAVREAEEMVKGFYE